MWALRWYDWRLIGPVGCLLLLGGLWLGWDLTQEVTATQRTVFVLPWGDGARAAGLDDTGRARHGPVSFALHRERVYLIDQANERLLVTTTGGEPWAAWPLAPLGDPPPRLSDLAIDDHGNLFLAAASAPQIYVLDDTGGHRSTLDVNPAAPGGVAGPDPLWRLEQIALDRTGLLYLSHAYLDDEKLTQGLSRLAPQPGAVTHLALLVLPAGGEAQLEADSLLPAPAHSFALGPDGQLFVESPGPDGFTRIVRAYGDDYRLRKQWTIRRDHWIEDARLAGVDSRGWAYLALNPGRSSGRILVLAPAHGMLYEIDPQWRDGYHANVFARVDGDRLWLSRPGPEGWRLEEWRLRSRVRIVRAGSP